MKDKLVSIVVPVYNVEEYLEKCVGSLVKQTYSNIEIILVNDGSTDNSLSICKKLAEKDNRLKVINKKNGGLSDARNKGIDFAKGEYITFVDSDDWIELDTVAEAIETIEKDESDIVVYGISNDYDNGKVKKYPPKKKECIDKKTALIYLNSYKGINISACNKLYRKCIFNDIMFPFGKICEDYYTMYKIFDKCNKISIIPHVKYHYFQRTNSITRGTKINMDYLYASEEQLDFFKKNYPDILYAAITGYVFTNIVLYNTRLLRNIVFDKRSIQKNMRKYKNEVMNNKYLNSLRKIQFYIFSYLPNLYDFIILIKRRY